MSDNESRNIVYDWVDTLKLTGKRIPGKDPELASKLRDIGEQLLGLADEYDDHYVSPMMSKIMSGPVDSHIHVWGSQELPTEEDDEKPTGY